MLRLIFIILLSFVVAVGAAWLADNPGRVAMDWHGWRLETTAATFVLLLVLAAGLLFVVFRIGVWLLRDTPFAPERRREARHKKGLAAVHMALTALAAGRLKDAQRQAEHAVRWLGATPLTLTLRAQAAALRRDDHGVHEALVALSSREDGGLLGHKGLLERALIARDLKEARRLVEDAASRDPEAPWVDQASFDIAVRSGDWTEARSHLTALRRHKLVADDAFRRLDGTLAFLEARDADLSGRSNETLRLTQEGLKGDPRLTPAAVLAARAARREDRKSLADSILVDAWKARPHPDLVAAALEGYENETAAVRYRRVTDLVKGLPDDAASRLARAAAAMVAARWQDARADLQAVLKTDPSALAFELMAQVEEGQSADRDAATKWRAEAGNAPGEPRWVCGACGSARDRWAARCPECAAFASHDWRRPGEGPYGRALDPAGGRPLALPPPASAPLPSPGRLS